MPYALGYATSSLRPAKRRRIYADSAMAGRSIVNEAMGRSSMEQTRNKSDSRKEAEREHMIDIQTSDREELIQCLKRGQRPKWVPKPGLRELCAEEEALQEERNTQNDKETLSSPSSNKAQADEDLMFGLWASTDEPVERPRSALHRGNFDLDDRAAAKGFASESQGDSSTVQRQAFPLSDSPPSWLEDEPFPTIGRALSGSRALETIGFGSNTRPRAPSLGSSLSSSFVMRIPTSPLVNAVNNPSLDFSPKSSTKELEDEGKKGRRRTMPPNSFQSYSTSATDVTTPNFSRPLPHPTLRRESSLPYQTHQPRRSLGSFTYQSSMGSVTPRLQMRRPSLGSDFSPRQRSSMVGSFEESILRGRMSSPASKPFDFVAQIGVMGKGDCPSNLKCPAHVIVPFQAVFYSYPSSYMSRSIADDAPSPYVGTMDLERHLKTIQLGTKRRRTADREEADSAIFSASDPRSPENTPIGKALAREAEVQQLQKPNTKIHIGGAYRVPQQGQLQIIIKNPNKTAVKLFLVPYDLKGMEPGTKTFVRQRSYSSGTIIEDALSEKSPELDFSDPLKDKYILRYLIHLRFCCPTKGKFYLYDNIRVVFANRVPDGKEKLRNEVQLPEPRFSPWKPTRTPQRSRTSSSMDVFTGVSSPSTPPTGIFDDMRAMNLQESTRDAGQASRLPSIQAQSPLASHEVLPRYISRRQHNSERSIPPFKFPDVVTDRETPQEPLERALSPVQGFYLSTSQRSSPIPGSGSGASTTRSFSPIAVEAGNGLLSKQFNALAASGNSDGAENDFKPRQTTIKLAKTLSRDSASSNE